MKTYSINPQTQEIKELDLELQANTVYSFFNTISIDELTILQQHTIYSDGDAMSKGKTPFFIGDQLAFGEVLVLGKDEFLDIEVTIPKEELQSLIDYEVPPFYTSCIDLIKSSDLNLYKSFEVAKDEDEVIKLNPEWVLGIFNIADEKTKEYFIDQLKVVVQEKNDVAEYFRIMAALALKATSN